VEALTQAGVSLAGIDAIAVTQGPGLVGALLVGICVAKGIAFALNKPLVAVNHLEAHMLAIFLEKDPPPFPFIGMVVSGGHTNLYLVKDFLDMHQLGQTLDDAAGEAFDKVAKMLGLPYPGGISIEKLAQEGNPEAIKFPRPMLDKEGYNVSFSGLKTAVANYLRHHQAISKADIAASFQEAVVDTLVTKSIQAAKDLRLPRLVMAGGVAANKRLREKLFAQTQQGNIEVYFPAPSLCTDNAAMVAALGFHYLKANKLASFDFDAISRYPTCLSLQDAF
ncbi:MAG: tRNA (adenosine(37)-N6)-threonylcarbamoyltransferase complex transferase subunit TsaD, partial [Candidatus Desulfofervidaceae bacterium]|nr:tRNA (adenosine(37)-N6)-threonylcarbamoyltransferase complex transferase subunit TsaD [Candidatus Desulfofervidaceae bacterium]